MAAVTSINSIMFVLAPLISTPLLARVGHLPSNDWRIGATFYVSALLQAVALLMLWRHFRREPGRPGCRHRTLTAGSMHDKILILDFGAQYTQLIARRLRETHVYCEIHPFDVDDAFVRSFAPKGIILSGGPESVTEGDTPRAPAATWTQRVPVLGICYGMQTMAAQLGGTVESGHVREFGYAEVRARGHSALLRGIQDRANRRGARSARRLDEPRRQGHGDAAGVQADRLVRDVRDRGDGRRGARLLRGAVSSRGHAHDTGRRRARALRARHLRLRHRLEHGRLRGRGDRRDPGAGRHRGGDPRAVRRRRFVGRGRAHSRGDRRPADLRVRRPRPAAPERGDAGDGHVRHASRRPRASTSTRARRCTRRSPASPIPSRSAGSSAGSSSTSSSARPRSCRTRNGSRRARSIQTSSSRRERRPRRRTRSSRTTTSAGFRRSLHLKLLEPLRELFKDEVRELGQALGLPREMVFRHPFPGPGLGVRILGAVTPEAANLLRRADAIFIDELRQARDDTGKSWYDLTAQAFAVFLPGALGRRDGGRAHLRARCRAARRADDRFHDGALRAAAARTARQGGEPDHQRSARHQPRHVRHLEQAAGDDRVGVTARERAGRIRALAAFPPPRRQARAAPRRRCTPIASPTSPS